jgi:hypothetical protein
MRAPVFVTFIFGTTHHQERKDSMKSNISVGKPLTLSENYDKNGFLITVLLCTSIISDDIGVFRPASRVSPVSIVSNSGDIGFP